MSKPLLNDPARIISKCGSCGTLYIEGEPHTCTPPEITFPSFIEWEKLELVVRRTEEQLRKMQEMNGVRPLNVQVAFSIFALQIPAIQKEHKK